MNGYIKLDRKLLDWCWYHDANTFRLWIHLLLTARFNDGKFENVQLHAGDVVTSYKSLSKALSISIQQARTAVGHLVSTQEITISPHRHFSVISIKNWNQYQQGNRLTTSYQQADNKLPTSYQQQRKNDKNERMEEEDGGTAAMKPGFWEDQ